MDNKLFICFNAFLLLFIFLAGGVNKIVSFQGTVEYLETKINAIQFEMFRWYLSTLPSIIVVTIS